MADTLETVTAEDRAAWEQLEQQAADAAFAAKEGAEMADAARMQVPAPLSLSSRSPAAAPAAPPLRPPADRYR